MHLKRYLLLVCLLCPVFAYGQGVQVKDVAQKLVNTDAGWPWLRPDKHLLVLVAVLRDRLKRGGELV